METNFNPTPTPTQPVNPSSCGLFTWRTARRLLVGAAVIATLIAVFYAEENWRGKRAWEECRRALEAHGVTLNWNDFIPPPVPDEQNIFKAPHMTEWFVGRKSTTLFKAPEHPKTRSIGNATNAIQTEADAREYLAWSEQLEPNLAIIREALKRPYARFDCNYDRPQEIDVPNFASSRMLAQTLAQRAHSHLLLGDPEKALQDLTLLHEFCQIFEGAPTGRPMTLVAAMIDVAVRGLHAKIVAEGVQRQTWRESHLVVLQRQLAEIDLAPVVIEAFRAEQASTARILTVTPRANLVNWYSDWGKRLMLKYAPEGWIYQNLVAYAHVTHGVERGPFPERVIDIDARTVAARETDEVQRAIDEHSDSAAPYRFLAFRLTPNYARGVQLFARTQTSANQTAIACALERHRLARGEYPEALSALAPEFMTSLPHDLFGGHPLQYRRTADGKFALYSIGWNEKDDGGIVVPGADGKEDFNSGDWVWPVGN